MLVAQAAAILRRGGLIAFPTETVYGLGANALDAEAVRGIFTAKGRPARNPVILHVADAEQVQQVAAEWPDLAARLASRFWPGPLTLVLPRRGEVPDVVTGGGATVGVRVPAHPVALALLRVAGIPVAAPSANVSNRLSPTRAEHVLADLDGRIEAVLDAGPCPGGLESTVLDVTCSPPRLLRPGLVTAEEIEALIGPITARPTESAADAPLPAPGMLDRHYAPRTPTWVWEDAEQARAAADAACQRGAAAGLVLFGVQVPTLATVLWLPLDAAVAASHLYNGLHQLDKLGLAELHVALPPDEPAWRAVRDRLLRSGPRGTPR